MSAFVVSMQTALSASLINFFLGILAAYLVANMKKGRALMDGIFTLPMVLPPTVVGFFLLLIFGRSSHLGWVLKTIGIEIIFTRTGAILAAVVVSFPLMYRTSLGAFDQVDKEIIDAAKTLGVSRFKRFIHILIPLAMPGLISGLILTFARAMGEFGATIMLAGNIPNKTQNMSTAIYSAVQAGDTRLALIWSTVIVAINFIMMILMNLLSKRINRRIGR